MSVFKTLKILIVEISKRSTYTYFVSPASAGSGLLKTWGRVLLLVLLGALGALQQGTIEIKACKFCRHEYKYQSEF